MTLALILLALLVSAVAGAAYYHLRTLEARLTEAFQRINRQAEQFSGALEAERAARIHAQDLQARYSLLLAGKISELQTKPRGQLVLFAPPRDRN